MSLFGSAGQLDGRVCLSVFFRRKDSHVVLAGVVDNLEGAPLAVAVAVLLDLEPAIADARVCGRIVDLLEVGQGRAQVAGVHDIVRAGVEGVPPDGLDRGAGGDGDDVAGRGRRVRAAVASNVVGRDIGDGAVVGRGPDTVRDRVPRAVGLELDEDGVRRGRRGRREEREGLHCVVVYGSLEEEACVVGR